MNLSHMNAQWTLTRQEEWPVQLVNFSPYEQTPCLKFSYILQWITLAGESSNIRKADKIAKCAFELC